MSKPKASQYKASPVEKINAAIALKDKQRFREKFSPVLQAYVASSFAGEESLQGVAEGRAQADTMQALTAEGPNLGTISRVDTAANRASGAIANMLQANVLAKDVKNQQKVGVLATARGQTADAGSGLAQASKLARSEDLNRASAALSRSVNIMGNIGKIGSSAMTKGLDASGFSYNK